MFTKTMLISSFNNFIQDEDFICASVPGSMFCGSNLRKEIPNTNPGRSLKNFSYLKTQKPNMQLKYQNLFYLCARLKRKQYDPRERAVVSMPSLPAKNGRILIPPWQPEDCVRGQAPRQPEECVSRGRHHGSLRTVCGGRHHGSLRNV